MGCASPVDRGLLEAAESFSRRLSAGSLALNVSRQLYMIERWRCTDFFDCILAPGPVSEQKFSR